MFASLQDSIKEYHYNISRAFISEHLLLAEISRESSLFNQKFTWFFQQKKNKGEKNETIFSCMQSDWVPKLWDSLNMPFLPFLSSFMLWNIF